MGLAKRRDMAISFILYDELLALWSFVRNHLRHFLMMIVIIVMPVLSLYLLISIFVSGSYKIPPTLITAHSAPHQKNCGLSHRVLIVSFDVQGPIKNGGIGTALSTLAIGLSRHDDIEVEILFLSNRKIYRPPLSSWAKLYSKFGIRFQSFDIQPGTSSHLIEHSYKLYKYIRELNFDVVHFHDWRGPGAFLAYAKSLGDPKLASTTVITSTHGPQLWHKTSNQVSLSVSDIFLDVLERLQIQHSDVVVSPSQYMLDWMKEHQYFIQSSRVIPNPIFASVPVHPGKISVRELVFFGRLESRKGLFLFCEVLVGLRDIINDQKITVTFLGTQQDLGYLGSSQDYLKAMSTMWGFPYQVISDFDSSAALEYLRKSGRVAVLPSLVDNYPYTVLECVVHGIPLIASRVGGIPEIIQKNLFSTKQEFQDLLLGAITNGIEPAVAPNISLSVPSYIGLHKKMIPIRQDISTSSRSLGAIIVTEKLGKNVDLTINDLQSQTMKFDKIMILELLPLGNRQESTYSSLSVVHSSGGVFSSIFELSALMNSNDILVISSSIGLNDPRVVERLVLAKSLAKADCVTATIDDQPFIPNAGFLTPIAGNILGPMAFLVSKESIDPPVVRNERLPLDSEAALFLSGLALNDKRVESVPESLFSSRNGQFTRHRGNKINYCLSSQGYSPLSPNHLDRMATILNSLANG